MQTSTNHGLPHFHRHAARLVAAALGLAALVLLAGPASAQSAPSYQITWQQCFDRDSSADTDVYGTVGFTVPSTGERFIANMRLVHNASGSSLSFDYFAADGTAVATIDVSGAESVVRTTPYGQRVSQDAAIAFVEILGDPELQAPLQACVALCLPANQKLYTPLCLLSKTLCCGIVTDVCAACDFAVDPCYDAFHGSCQ